MAARTGICSAGRPGATARQASRNSVAKAHQPATESTDTSPTSRAVSRRNHGQAAAAAAAATSSPSTPAAGRRASSATPAARKTTEVPASRSAETAPRLRLSVSLRSSPPSGRSSMARTASPANPPGSTALMKAACQQRSTDERSPSSIPWPRATNLHRWACTSTPMAPRASAPTTDGQVRTPAAAANGPVPQTAITQIRIPTATTTCSRVRISDRRFMQRGGSSRWQTEQVLVADVEMQSSITGKGQPVGQPSGHRGAHGGILFGDGVRPVL